MIRASIRDLRAQTPRVAWWLVGNAVAVGLAGANLCARQDLISVLVLAVSIGLAQSIAAARTVRQIVGWIVLTTLGIPFAFVAATVVTLVIGLIAGSLTAVAGSQCDYFGLCYLGALLVLAPAIIVAGAIVGICQATVFVVQSGRGPRLWVTASILGAFAIAPLMIPGCNASWAPFLGLGYGLVTVFPFVSLTRDLTQPVSRPTGKVEVSRS